jgi:5'-deoxynucleotidase YfbR-like HD superfamily hydrolase
MQQSQARAIHDQLISLTEITVKLATVKRTVLYAKDHQENDAEHSLHLALTASEIAATYYPKLNNGLVTQFSIVHDLKEVYAGDVPTFDITQAQRDKKEARERLAYKRLLKELPPHTADMLRRYEEQKEPEARLVCLVDKLLPAAVHAIAAQANKEYFITTFNIQSLEQIDARNERFDAYLQKEFSEFDIVLIAQKLIIKSARDQLWPPASQR